MTKKDFELIAQTIQWLDLTPRKRADVAAMFAASLARTNGMFNRDRFLRACVVGANVRARS